MSATTLLLALRKHPARLDRFFNNPKYSEDLVAKFKLFPSFKIFVMHFLDGFVFLVANKLREHVLPLSIIMRLQISPSFKSFFFKFLKLSMLSFPKSVISLNVFLGCNKTRLETFPMFLRNKAGSIRVSFAISFPDFFTASLIALFNPFLTIFLKADLIEVFAMLIVPFTPAFTPNFTPNFTPDLTTCKGADAAPKVTADATSVTAPIANDIALSWATSLHFAIA